MTSGHDRPEASWLCSAESGRNWAPL